MLEVFDSLWGLYSKLTGNKRKNHFLLKVIEEDKGKSFKPKRLQII